MIQDILVALIVGSIIAGGTIVSQKAIDDRQAERATQLENLRFVRERSSPDPGTPRPFGDLDLRDQSLRGLQLANAYLTGADMTGAFLTGTDLMGADLDFANLVGADLTRANLTAADLTRASLLNADLINANLTNATLTGANLTGADLNNADLTDGDLSSGLIDNPTVADTADLPGSAIIGELDTKLTWINSANGRSEVSSAMNNPESVLIPRVRGRRVVGVAVRAEP